MAKIKTPLMRKSQLDPCEDLSPLIDQCRTDGQDICLKHIRDASFLDLDLSNLAFEQVLFENCEFDQTILKKSSFRDVVFESCDFSNTDFSNSWFHRCEFTDSKGIGANFSETSMNDVAIRNCNFRYANFSTVKFGTCSIVESDLSDATCIDCIFKSLHLQGSRFVGTDFFNTPLKDLDFSSGELAAIHVSTGATELKGMLVSLVQAAELARMLGVVIKD